ncbi:MAG: hypothetical protein B6D72_12380 [gamma proteobacterium symbiont of Ctena orbiculata]|nr:MAG: hypothetical protein B6D72_12380 [gamma proteobacterium symbiont of Ctena orbiculata]
MTHSDALDIGIENKPVHVLQDVFFTESLEGQSFQHVQFNNTGAKELKFENCDFRYCTFDRAYFHKCQFIKCNFTGSRFVDSNFRGASFDGCDFEYTTFRTTLIDSYELLRNLPAWPNARRELLRILRLNAESIGDGKAAKILVREELAASREHLKKARQAKEKYYSTKYRPLPKRLQAYWQSLAVWVDWHLWGHGEYPWRLLRTIMLGLVVAGLYRIVCDSNVTWGLTAREAVSASASHFLDVAQTFVGVIPDDFPSGLAATLSLFRYVMLGLFISVLYKRLSRR